MNGALALTQNYTVEPEMIRIPCPFCGVSDHTEFTYGGDGSIQYPALDAPLQDWHAAVFERDNILGRQTESWHHVFGCRQWLLIERDTLTHEIYAARLAHTELQAIYPSHEPEVQQ